MLSDPAAPGRAFVLPATDEVELDNLAGHSRLESALHAHPAAAMRNELRAPVSTRLLAAQHDGYYTAEKTTALVAAQQRRKLEKSEPASHAAEKLGAQ